MLALPLKHLQPFRKPLIYTISPFCTSISPALWHTSSLTSQPSGQHMDAKECLAQLPDQYLINFHAIAAQVAMPLKAETRETDSIFNVPVQVFLSLQHICSTLLGTECLDLLNRTWCLWRMTCDNILTKEVWKVQTRLRANLGNCLSWERD